MLDMANKLKVIYVINGNLKEKKAVGKKTICVYLPDKFSRLGAVT